MSEPIVCSKMVDYSQVRGNRVLPFIFTLNLEESILYPAAGELQRFCYDIKGVGEDNSTFADLSHFLLGICEEISQADIANVTVVVDGQPRNVIWGNNVEIKTSEHPDNPTGCIGLKFNFPLNKVDGTMRVCFSLREPHAIGPTTVCVFGGNTTANSLSICGPVCGSVEVPCDRTFFQTETVCVPVTVTPFATPGEAKTICCGNPVVTPNGQCSGNRRSCSFTIKQKLCIEIPVAFGAVIETGTVVVECGEVSEIECDCDEPEAMEEEPASQPMGTDRRYFG